MYEFYAPEHDEALGALPGSIPDISLTEERAGLRYVATGIAPSAVAVIGMATQFSQDSSDGGTRYGKVVPIFGFPSSTNWVNEAVAGGGVVLVKQEGNDIKVIITNVPSVVVANAGVAALRSGGTTLGAYAVLAGDLAVLAQASVLAGPVSLPPLVPSFPTPQLPPAIPALPRLPPLVITTPAPVPVPAPTTEEEDDKEPLPTWVLPVAIGGGVLVLGIVVLSMRKGKTTTIMRANRRHRRRRR